MARSRRAVLEPHGVVTPTVVELAGGRPLAALGAEADVVALGVRPGGDDEPVAAADAAAEVERHWGVAASDALRRERATGRAGELVAAGGRAGLSVLLVGVGDGSAAALRTAGAALARRVRGRGQVVLDAGGGIDDEGLTALVEGIVLGGYAFARRSEPLAAAKRPAGHVLLTGVGPDRQSALERALVGARATWLARDLGNEPSSTKDPAWLAARAAEAGEAAGLRVRALDERALREQGFGGLLAVGAGSASPPRLVELSYDPPGRRRRAVPHVVLVGKGITFDSGGITIKPREAMAPMKMDMGGAAAVLAAMTGLRDLGVAVRVTALLALAENMPSGSAARPGDVIRQYDGTTVEVLNPDAEGRVVLADAMGYAVRRLSPDVLVDVATLTGAVSVALGRRTAAVLSPDDDLVALLRSAGEAAGEPLWWLPLVEDYRDALDSPVADVANIATRKGVQAGTVMAGLFLQRFAGQVRWAHLDISGAAKSDGEAAEVVRGATGWGARTLLRWLERADPLTPDGKG